MEQNTNSHNKMCGIWCGGCHTRNGALGWGIFFLVLGGYFLAQDLGYISNDVSIWPILFGACGLYLIVKNLGR